MRRIHVEIGLDIPDYVTNDDVYSAVDLAALAFEERHMSATDMAVYGLPPDDGGANALPQEEAA